MSNRVNILTPVGRLVMGSLYKPSTKDPDGNPLVFKSGANAGQARSNYFLALAVPKDGRPWQQTEWGQVIYSVAAAAFPQAVKFPTFAFKVTDGDDTTPNSRGKANANTEGFLGNWILRFSGSFAPKVYREENGAYVQVTEPDYIKPGYFVQISGTVSGNGSQQRPGLYLNHSMVAFTAYGQEIHFGPDANSVGFGQAPLPSGALSTPVASGAPLPGQVFKDNPTFNVPPPPLAAPNGAPKMTAKAQGASYQAYITAGWTDAKLLAEGLMA